MCYDSGMVAIRFKSSEERARGYLLLARAGQVRTLSGEIYVFNEGMLPILDEREIAYEKIPFPVTPNEVDALRDTLTTAL